MIDKTKEYSLNELLNIYSLYNIDFKYYGNNNNGELELYLKTDADKVSVFISNLKISKKEYLKLTEKEARKIKFIYDREVNELDLFLFQNFNSFFQSINLPQKLIENLFEVSNC